MATTEISPVLPMKPNVFSVCLKETKYEFLKCLRLPMYSVSTIVFPIMFYVLFGLIMGRQNIGNISTTTYLIAAYGTFGVMGASLGGLISFYVALSRPQLFSRVGGQSSALLLEEARITALLNSFSARAAFYLDVGKYEPRYLPVHQRIVARLTALGYPCFFQQLAGGHNWTSWRAHLKDLLTFLWRQ